MEERQWGFYRLPATRTAPSFTMRSLKISRASSDLVWGGNIQLGASSLVIAAPRTRSPEKGESGLVGLAREHPFSYRYSDEIADAREVSDDFFTREGAAPMVDSSLDSFWVYQ
ncbi:hypothetical protein CRG98_025918 [Punica granatum]|uniref:Uncharacterized protein n=1 Tax=Punica granatum TaxID=22663 RepID=A0A2I0JBR3_PUNGR|nr:hypothetical protein CRG98_025918 [Punica granatum]